MGFAPLALPLPAASRALVPPLALPAFKASTSLELPASHARRLAAKLANPAANAWSARKVITLIIRPTLACVALCLDASPAKEIPL